MHPAARCPIGPCARNALRHPRSQHTVAMEKNQIPSLPANCLGRISALEGCPVPLLAIETSGDCCSVALGTPGGQCIELSAPRPQSHAKVLTLLIETALQKAHIDYPALKGIAVSDGPGSYTGLRIGASTAKGMAFALGIPMFSVPTLQAIALAMKMTLAPEERTAQARFLPMIDARRLEVYTQPFDDQLKPLEGVQSKIFNPQEANYFAKYPGAYAAGSGTQKGIEYLTHLGLRPLGDIHFAAEQILRLGLNKYLHHEPVSTAYYTPFYLKAFQASRPKPGILDRLRAGMAGATPLRPAHVGPEQ